MVVRGFGKVGNVAMEVDALHAASVVSSPSLVGFVSTMTTSACTRILYYQEVASLIIS